MGCRRLPSRRQSGGILYQAYAVSIPEVSLTAGTAAISLQMQVSLTAGICQMEKAFHGVLMLEDLPDGTAAEMEPAITTFVSQQIERASRWIILHLGLPPVLWDKAGPSPDHISLTAAARTEVHRLIESHWNGVRQQHIAWFSAAVQRDLMDRQEPYRDIVPAWAQVTLRGLDCTCALVSAGTEKNIRVVLYLRVRLRHCGYREKEASTSLLPMVRIGKSQWSPFLWSAIQSCADDLLQAIPGWLPLWARCPGGIPSSVQLLYSGPFVHGAVSVLWQGTWLSNKSQIIHLGGRPANTPDIYLLTDLSGNPIPDSALPFRKANGKPGVPLATETMSKLPNDAAILQRLAIALDLQLKSLVGKGEKPPKAVILMAPRAEPQIRFGRQTIPLPKPNGKSIRKRRVPRLKAPFASGGGECAPHFP